MLDLRVDGARVVRPYGQPRIESIGMKGGKIAAVGEFSDSARNIIDASGLYAIPGVIDTHVHIGFSDPVEEWTTESRSAALGGVTTMLVYFRDPRPYDRLLPEVLQLAGERSYVDFAIHLAILNDHHLDRFEEYVDRFAIRSIKMYTTYKSGELLSFGIIGQDDGFILDVLDRAAHVPSLTVNVHCENDDIVERGRAHWVDSGEDPISAWSAIRPVVAEVEAIRRIALFARSTGATVLIPHVSSIDALGAVVGERASGSRLFAETCPQYLSAPEMRQAGTRAKVNPPVRPEADARALWASVEDGAIDVLGTDHAAHGSAVKDTDDVLDARPGFPGLGTLVPVLMNGISKGLMSFEAFARSQSRAAKIFDLPNKGQIAPDFDADVVLVDMEAHRHPHADQLQSISDFSPFAHLELIGWPIITIKGGVIIAEHGEVVADRPSGRYLRETPGRELA